jgi:hypothetical protein
MPIGISRTLEEMLGIVKELKTNNRESKRILILAP